MHINVTRFGKPSLRHIHGDTLAFHLINIATVAKPMNYLLCLSVYSLYTLTHIARLQFIKPGARRP